MMLFVLFNDCRSSKNEWSGPPLKAYFKDFKSPLKTKQNAIIETLTLLEAFMKS